jgi:hypothetical protein
MEKDEEEKRCSGATTRITIDGSQLRNIPTTTLDTDSTEHRPSKKAKKGPTVSFATTTSPSITEDDVFVASLFSEGIKIQEKTSAPV